MQLVLPPRVDRPRFDAAIKAFEGAVGAEWVFATDQDRTTYLDAYALGDGLNHVPSAAVAPQSAEEVQAVVRLANEHRIPLWPLSRGKNLGYGQAAPFLSGTVVVDLGRMNRILEVNVKHAYCVLEPGVGFYQLYDHLKAEKIPLWISAPGNAWGSVLGNALERGIGYTPYGDNTEQICGMEVVLPDGDLMRTGMGAMTGDKGWQHYKYGFGPSWDQVFIQGNYGVVTKAGLWLQPEPEMTAKVFVNLPKPDDIGWAIDVLGDLRRRDVVNHNFVLGNYLHDASVPTQRSEWYTGPGAIPDSVSEKIMAKYGIGWWRFQLSAFGYEGEVKAKVDVIKRGMEPRLGHELTFTEWRRGDDIEKAALTIPSVLPLQIVNWYGGRGAHIGFSPVMPQDGALALEQFHRMKGRFEQFGLDYYTSFTMGRRHVNNVNLIIYDRDNADLVKRARGLFDQLIVDAKAHGYGEYRTHLDFMQPVSQTYDFNNHAMNRLNERVKDALDPNGVISPGKNGIWPRAYRETRA